MKNKSKFINSLTDFGKGIIAGFLFALIIFGLLFGIFYFKNKNKELKEYVERQQIIDELLEDYGNRDPDEFLEIPDVRRAADGATDEFERKLNEALQRLRDRPIH